MILAIEKTFSCAHFYHQAAWDEKKNQEEFGKCFTAYGHGHDYVLKLKFQVDSSHSVALFEQVVEDFIQTLDHQHLNFVIPEFKTRIPTTENFLLFIHQNLSSQIQKKNLEIHFLNLKLQENPEIWTELEFQPD